MDILDSAIWKEVNQIATDGSNPVHFKWRCELLINDDIIEPTKLISLDTKRQYNSQFADETIVKVLLPQGIFAHKVFPNRDILKVAVYKEPIGELNNEDDLDVEITSNVYRGVLIDPNSDLLETPSANISNEETSDLGGVQEYNIQLVDLAAEQLRLKTVGGIYREMSPTEVLRGVLTIVSGGLDLDEESSLRGVDIVEGDNTERRDHTIIPQGTPAIKFPKYLQEHAGGIYSSGLGYYLQDRIWYVYPEFNIKRFELEPRNLTVFNIPKNRLPEVERTYITDGDRLTIIATGETKHIDDSENLQHNEGNGVRFLDANRVIGSWRRVKENQASISRVDNMHEFVLKERKVGLNNAPISPRRITANPFFETSQISRRLGTFVQTHWENANAELIYPGMPVKYVYLDGDVISEVYGIVIGADHYVSLLGKGISAIRYRCDVVLTLFIENIE